MLFGPKDPREFVYKSFAFEGSKMGKYFVIALFFALTAINIPANAMFRHPIDLGSANTPEGVRRLAKKANNIAAAREKKGLPPVIIMFSSTYSRRNPFDECETFLSNRRPYNEGAQQLITEFLREIDKANSRLRPNTFDKIISDEVWVPLRCLAEQTLQSKTSKEARDAFQKVLDETEKSEPKSPTECIKHLKKNLKQIALRLKQKKTELDSLLLEEARIYNVDLEKYDPDGKLRKNYRYLSTEELRELALSLLTFIEHNNMKKTDQTYQEHKKNWATNLQQDEEYEKHKNLLVGLLQETANIQDRIIKIINYRVIKKYFEDYGLILKVKKLKEQR